MRSPTTYFGGKGGMVNKILPHFPEHSSYKIYVEAFGGGASLLFAKEPSPIEIYNDLEQNVFSLFHVLSNPELYEAFKLKADASYYSREIRECSIQQLKQIEIGRAHV